jgi:hypothetical protein
MTPVSASTTTPLTARISSLFEEPMITRMALEQQMHLKTAMETAISKTRSGTRSNMKLDIKA